MVAPTDPAVLAKKFAAMADVGNEKRKNIDPRMNALVGAVAQDSPSKRQRVSGTAPGSVSGADLDAAGEGIFRSFAEGRARTTESLSLDQRVAPVMEHFGSVFEIFMKTCTEAQSLVVQLDAKDTEIAILKRILRVSKRTSEDDRKRMIAEFTKEKEAVNEAAQKLVDEASVNYTLVGFENFRIQVRKDFPEVDWSGKHYIHGLVPQPTSSSLLGNENNFDSPPPNMTRGAVSSSSIDKEIQTHGGRCADSQKASTPRKESSPNKKMKVESNEEIGLESGPNAEKSKLQETSKQNPNGVIEYPNPDFTEHVPNSQFTASNPHQQSTGPQQSQSVPQRMPATFWTGCPFCIMRYEYSIEFENKNLLCLSCTKPFMALNMGGGPREDVPSVPSSKAARNTNRKRGGKQRVESRESSDGSSSDESEDAVDENADVQGAGSNGGECRRSSCQKQKVIYKEPLIDDDDNEFESPPNRSRGSGSSSSSEKEIKMDGGSAPQDESLPNKKMKVESCEEDGVERGQNGEKSDLEENSKPNLNGGPEYPNPDFSNFDKERTANSFAANQVWAVYDEKEGMPRNYALIKKIYQEGFRVKIAWLEADANERAELEWTLKGLPVACGRFKPGKSQDITDSLMFSHKVSIDKTSSEKWFSYVIYPRLGQTWALFKDMDIKCTNEKQQSSKYELVTIVSEFRQYEGIKVSYLRKVKGFVSIFQTSIRNAHDTFHVPKSELFRFSHQIPSFKMTGEEREGVPSGSFELDPAALPTDLDQFY